MSNNKYRVKVCICQEFSTPFTSDLFFFKCSSSESKASVNFSLKNNLSVVSRCRRCKLITFYHKTKLNTKHPSGNGFQVCSNEW